MIHSIKKVSWFSTFIIFLFINNAFASPFTLDINEIYNEGETTIKFQIQMTANESLEFSGFDLAFIYDDDELNYKDSQIIAPPPLIPDLMNTGVKHENGTITGFLASGLLGNLSVEKDDSFDLGWIEFNMGETSIDEKTDFNFAYGDEFEDAPHYKIYFSEVEYTDDLRAAAPENFTDLGTPAPVPVPSAVWLLGTGLLGLAGIRRKTA